MTPLKFGADIFIRIMAGMGVKMGYFEDVESSLSDPWRTGSFSMSWIMFFDPKEDNLKVLS